MVSNATEPADEDKLQCRHWKIQSRFNEFYADLPNQTARHEALDQGIENLSLGLQEIGETNIKIGLTQIASVGRTVTRGLASHTRDSKSLNRIRLFYEFGWSRQRFLKLHARQGPIIANLCLLCLLLFA